ncbi:g8486 [Coccomyxa elongata]
MAAPSLPPSALPLMAPSVAPANAAQPPIHSVITVGVSPPTPGYTPGAANQPEQFMAAKYFTFIFFGLSCFVILLFGGFVVCHCYRRIRRRDLDIPVVQLSGNPGNQPGEVVITVPMKEGRLVSHPDGGMEVAYIPDTPRSPGADAKSQPTTPSTGDRPPPSPAGAESPADSSGVSQPGATQLPTSSSAHIGSGVAAPHTGVSSPRTGLARSSSAGMTAEELRASNNDRLDEYWRRRHAQMYHIF